MASVQLTHLTKKFRDVVAVMDLTLEIHDKEFLVLVGPSGCGKTTALRMVAGLEEPTEGDIYIADVRVNDISPKDRDIAMVFQNYALYPHMTAYDNMAFGLKLRRMRRDEIKRRVQEVAGMLGMGGLLKRKPKELSGGQRQRVALGRAIVRQPKVFLMDEPLSNLDAKLRVQTRAELIKLHQRLGVTTIYVTHDQMEAMSMGDRIAVLNDGLMHQCDSPINVYNHPANLFVAGFIGSPAMNFVDGTVSSHDGNLFVEAGPFRLMLPPEKAQLVADRVGEAFVFGVRPEDIHDKEFSVLSSDTYNTAVLNVEVIEMMGDRAIVYSGFDGSQVVATINAATRAREGAPLDVVVDMDRIHLFEKDTGKALF